MIQKIGDFCQLAETSDNNTNTLLECAQEEILGKSILNEDASLRYFIGYIAFHFFKRIDCKNCYTQLVKEGEEITLSHSSEFLIFYRNYTNNSDFGNLKAPTDAYFEMCKIFLYVFKVMYNESPEMRNIKETIKRKCIEQVAGYEHFSNWFSSENPCREHYCEILDFFLLILLRKHAQWTSIEIPNKTNRKLQILSDQHKRTTISKKSKKRKRIDAKRHYNLNNNYK